MSNETPTMRHIISRKKLASESIGSRSTVVWFSFSKTANILHVASLSYWTMPCNHRAIVEEVPEEVEDEVDTNGVAEEEETSRLP